MSPPKKKKKQSAADFIAKNFKKSFKNFESKDETESKNETESKVDNVEKQILENKDEPEPMPQIQTLNDSVSENAENRLSDAFKNTEAEELLNDNENEDFDDESENQPKTDPNHQISKKTYTVEGL